MSIRSFLLAFTLWMTLWISPISSLAASADPLVVAVSETYPPFTQIDINGEPAGMFVDIWNLWAKKTGREVTFQATDWVGTLAALKNGGADIHSGLYFSEKRAQWMDFSQAFYSNQSSFYHRIDDTPPPSDSTLEGVKIGVIKGYLQETFLREAYAKANILTFSDDRELIKALASGAIDLFLSEDPTIEALLAETGMMGRIGSVGAAIQTHDLYASVLNGRTDILKMINDGFQGITSSEWAAIEARWIRDPTKRVFGRDKIKDIKLTAQEEKWISENPIIRTIALENWPPVDFMGSDGNHAGIAADILKLAADRAGLKVEPQFGPWANMLAKLQDGEIDLAPEIYYTEERAKTLAYSRPFLPLYNAIFVGSDVKGIKGISDLVGRYVAVEKGYALEGMLKSDYPGITPVIVNSTLDALKKVSIGEVDAYIGSQYVASYLIDQNLLHGIKPVAHFGEKPQFLHMAAPKDRTILRDIMDKALGSISEAEKRTIIGRYVAPATFMLAASDRAGLIDLTDEEKSWLKKRPVIRIANETDWPPFDYVENGKPVGFSIDMIKKAADSVGLNVEFVNGFIWSDLVKQLHDGSIDVLPAVYFTPERNKTMAFTSGYAVNPPALVFQKTRTELNSLEDLKGLKIAVLSDTSFDQLLKERYPDIIRVPVDGAVQGMEAVAFGQADGFIESLSVASTLMEKNLLSNIRLVRVDGLQKKGENDLRMAVKKEDTILREILQKGLSGIDGKTKSQLFEKHFNANRSLYEINTAKKITLTADEKAWLKDHPVLRVAPDPGYPPLEFFDENGKYQGLAADFMRLVADRVGFQLEAVRKENWTAVLDALRSGEADFIAANSPTDEFLKEFIYSESYYRFYDAIITHDGIEGKLKLEDLAGKEVLVAEGWPEVHILKSQYPNIHVVEVENTLEAVTKVALREYDYAFAYFPTATHFIREQGLPGLRIAGIEGNPIADHAMFRKDSVILRNIITKGLASISEEERRTLKSRWIPSVNQITETKKQNITLTDKEKGWLANHPVIRLATDDAWPPFEYRNENGEYSGFVAGFVETIGNRLGIKMMPSKGVPWTEGYRLVTKGELDVVPGIAPSPEREKHLLFTKPYLTFPLVIATNENTPYVGGLADLDGLKTGVVKGYIMESILRDKYPDFEIITFDNSAQGLEALENGSIDAVFDNLAVISYETNRLHLKAIKIAAPTDNFATFTFGVRKDWPELVSLLNKALDSISEKERAAIRNTWLAVNFQFGQDLKTILLWAVPIGTIALLIIAFVVVWNRKLGEARNVAEEATKAKATFLATMSHEIRTPMGGVIGMVDLLQQSKMTDDQRQMINTVGDSAQSLLTIINDILDFSKIEAGKLDLEEIPISVRDVVEGAGEALAVTARNKNIGLSVYVDPDLPDALIGDQVRLRQILFNFGTNAIKFTEKGKVLIRADMVPSNTKEKIAVRFQVIDEGIGIPEEAQKTLFQAFSQVDASTTRRFGGTGLGLTICQRLTEIMNGEIGVESVLGEGSTFSATVALPIAKVHTFESDGHDLSGLNILFAHHDDDLRGLTPRYIEHWNANVTTIAEIDKIRQMALDALKDGVPFDVICLGSSWPTSKQVETVELLQAEKILTKVRYVVACRDRVKASRKEIDNTVYLDAGPLRRAAFIKSVAVAAGRASPDVEYDDSEATTDVRVPLTVAEAEAMGQLILLAEDNLTNQDVIRRQLTMLGYTLVIANDGQEALELLKSKSFAILLTDCHMPNMDGFELTEAIRKSEKDKDIRFPIVAVTASVMKEEVDHCFASGMDDFIAKPMEMKRLKEILQKWMPVSEDTTAEAAEVLFEEDKVHELEAKNDDDGGNNAIDPSALKSVFGDDEETFKEILNDFIEPATSNVGEIDAAFTKHSADGVAMAAHKLKSSARSVGANDLADLCQILETAGKAEDWDEIDKATPSLSNIFQKVIDYIENL